MNHTTYRIAWRYNADKMTATELEQLIDRLQRQEQKGDNVSHDLYHLTKYLEAKEKNLV